MTILNKDVWQKGNFIEFAYLEEPLSLSETDWPKGELYEQAIFFEMEIDLLGDYCWLTKQYSPFDPDCVYLDISASEELFALAGTFMDWAAIILRKEESAFVQLQQETFCETHPVGTPTINVRCDLVETLQFLAGKIIEAARKGHTIYIVGV